MKFKRLLLASLLACSASIAHADWVDLVINKIRFDDRVYEVGDEIDLRFEIINIGNAATYPRGRDIEASVYLSEDRILVRDDILLSRKEERTTILWPWGMNDNFFDTEAGYRIDEELTDLGPPNTGWGYSFYIIIDIDSDDSVRDETDEYNLYILNEKLQVASEALGEPIDFEGWFNLDEFPRMFSETYGWLRLEPEKGGFWIYREDTNEWSFLPHENDEDEDEDD